MGRFSENEHFWTDSLSNRIYYSPNCCNKRYLFRKCYSEHIKHIKNSTKKSIYTKSIYRNFKNTEIVHTFQIKKYIYHQNFRKPRSTRKDTKYLRHLREKPCQVYTFFGIYFLVYTFLVYTFLVYTFLVYTFLVYTFLVNTFLWLCLGAIFDVFWYIYFFPGKNFLFILYWNCAEKWKASHKMEGSWRDVL